jgi:hypothetical protein
MERSGGAVLLLSLAKQRKGSAVWRVGKFNKNEEGGWTRDLHAAGRFRDEAITVRPLSDL